MKVTNRVSSLLALVEGFCALGRPWSLLAVKLDICNTKASFRRVDSRELKIGKTIENQIKKSGRSTSEVFLNRNVAISFDTIFEVVVEGRNFRCGSFGGLVEFGDIVGSEFVCFFAVFKLDEGFAHATFLIYDYINLKLRTRYKKHDVARRSSPSVFSFKSGLSHLHTSCTLKRPFFRPIQTF